MNNADLWPWLCLASFVIGIWAAVLYYRKKNCKDDPKDIYAGDLVLNISEEGSYDLYLNLNGLPHELANRSEVLFHIITYKE